MIKGGVLGISIKSQDGFINFGFEDKGEGIRAKDLPKIYEPYFTTKRHGIGLGLAIVKRIVNAHGGHIRVDSTPDQGTRVVVSIPLTEGKS